MTMTLTVMEDTIAVPNGWWRQLLLGDCSISVLLNDGGGDKWLFSGMVIKQEAIFEEIYIGTLNVRKVTIPCKTLLSSLANVTIANLITELETHAIVDDQDTGKFCSIADIFASAIKLGFSQAYSTTHVSLSNAGGSDFLFTAFSSGLSRIITQLYWQMQTGTGGSYAHQGYTDPTDIAYWGETYANTLELLKAICGNFCVVPQYYYDLDDSKHKIRLLQKGRSYTESVTLPSPSKSSYNPLGGMPLSSLRVHDWNSEVHGWAWINGSERLIDVISATTWTPPATWEPDANVLVLWYPYESASWAPFAWETMYILNNSNYSYKVDQVTAYNYSTTGSTDFTTAIHRPWHKAILEYYRYRYYAGGRQEYVRTLPTVVPTGGTWDDLKIMVTTTIGGDAYTVTDLSRDFATGETQVTLLELS
jgi:hypothetical protein